MSNIILRFAIIRHVTRQFNLSSRYQNLLYSTQRSGPQNGRPSRNDASKSPGNSSKEQPANYYQAINQKTNEILQKYLKESPKFDKDRAQEFRAEITKEVGEIRKEWVKQTLDSKQADVINVSNKRQ